jgi:hypothetical protein
VVLILTFRNLGINDILALRFWVFCLPIFYVGIDLSCTILLYI